MAQANEYLDYMQGSIETELQRNVDALPKDFDNKRFALNCIALIRDNMAQWKKDYEKVDPKSIITAFVKGAFLDLDFFNKECYIIPYGKEATFQTDYKGEIKLAKKYSSRLIKDIYAKNVRKGDIFQETIIDGECGLKYRPEPFNDNEIVGTFAVIVFADGGIAIESMSRAEIEKVRNTSSKAPNSPAWKNYPGEMYKKTVLRRLLKTVDLHFDNTTQQSAFQGGSDVDFNKEVVIDITDEVRDPLAKDNSKDNSTQDKASDDKEINTKETEDNTENTSSNTSEGEPPSMYDEPEQIDITTLA